MSTTETVTLDVEYVDTTNPTALLEWYPGQTRPQDVELCLDVESGQLWLRVDGEVGNARPARHVHGLVQTWPVACLRPAAANALLDEVTEPAQLLLAHSEIYWDGANRRGSLDGTDEAERAAAAIEAATDPDEVADGDALQPLDAGDVYGQARTEILDQVGLTAETTDIELEGMRDTLEQEALAEGMVVLGIDRWLADERAELQRERTLADIAHAETRIRELSERITSDTEQRATEIRRAVELGSSLRDLARITGQSHQTIANIAHRS